ncbi:MAG: 4-(cytidine 5'-diphospho)-2-C-methyl-D-erythritol kinase [Lachnospiraceae bacterium]|nr:4-(cytidine 5'-diphospho)-2-C-methyl-D-erythritol kinase [Lachnospiraceae bacterium]
MLELRLKALAKINLGLDVLRRREDGYHEVRMIMQTVGLYDRIILKKTRKPGIRVKTNLYYLPENENNLVYQAAKLLIDEFEIKSGVFIDLQKFIPVAAGMAGGSSDAAAVLFGMNRMFSLRLSKEDLMKRGVKIGADVPYCIMRGTALAEGIGEQLLPLQPMPRCKVLIAKPPISVSTKFVYENLKLDEDTLHPDIDGLIERINAGDLRGAAARMGNVLESVTIPNYPVIAQIREEMIKGGALNAMMSGSGPTVFGLFEEDRLAQQAYQKLRRGDLAKQVYLTDIYNNAGKVSMKNKKRGKT